MKELKLGMNQTITRRDFISGAAVSISGSLIWPYAEAAKPIQGTETLVNNYPPIRDGMRGSHEGSYEVAHKLRDGVRWDNPEDSGERYDLVVVGGGLSGLASAWYYREANPDARMLILDNHDDFGGHAKRNEFWHDDRMILSHGGTENIENLHRYNDRGRHLLNSLGIDANRYSEFHNEKLYASYNLNWSVFFDRETFGEDKLAVGPGKPSWPEFFKKTPLSDAAQKELVLLYESDIDYLKDLNPKEKIAFLQKTSYEKYLLNVVGISPEAVSFVWRSATWAIGLDQLSAWVAKESDWPGTSGLGKLATNPELASKEPVFCQFPDGNATITRLLVRSLIPGVAPGKALDDVVTARFDYNAIDLPSSSVRIRLESTVIDVRHKGKLDSAEPVEVTYVRDNRAYRIKAERCIMACYNSAIPHICRELPDEQKAALSLAIKAPLIYTNVLIRNWTSFVKLGIRGARCPGSYFDSIDLTEPTNIGRYRHARKPEEAVVVRLFRAPLVAEMRGQPVSEQWHAARTSLLHTTFETFERNIRDQLSRILSPGGFDPMRDILAITVNRWPHGYAYGHDPESGQVAWMLDELPPERSPWIAARKPYGRIAIANSDATADAMTEGAFNAAQIAVDALLDT